MQLACTGEKHEPIVILDIPVSETINQYRFKLGHLLSIPQLYTAVVTEQYFADEYDRALLHEGLIETITASTATYRKTQQGFIPCRSGMNYAKYVRQNMVEDISLINAISRAKGDKTTPQRFSNIELPDLMERTYTVIKDHIKNNTYADGLLRAMAPHYMGVRLHNTTQTGLVALVFIGAEYDKS